MHTVAAILIKIGVYLPLIICFPWELVAFLWKTHDCVMMVDVRRGFLLTHKQTTPNYSV